MHARFARGGGRALTRLGALAAVTVLAAACGSTKTVTKTVTEAGTAKSGVGAPRVQVLYGYIKSMKQASSGGYVMDFDPAWFLSGSVANDAAADDGAIPRGQPVPNDNYVVNESHRMYTYKISPHARVTVLKSGPDGSPISVAELAKIVNGTSTQKLFEPISTGFWIRVDIDTVKSLDQQYKP